MNTFRWTKPYLKDAWTIAELLDDDPECCWFYLIGDEQFHASSDFPEMVWGPDVTVPEDIR